MGLGTDGCLLSLGTSMSESDHCGNSTGLGVKRTPRPVELLQCCCSNRLTYRTTFYIMTFCDWQDTETDGDCKYGYPYRKHSRHQTDNCSSGTGVGVKVAGLG